MAYADPQATSNPTTGQPILAAWGDVVRDDLEWFARNRYHVEVYSAAVQSIPNNTSTNLLFPTESFDVGGNHSTASNTDRITIPSGGDGKLLVVTGGYFPANSTGYRALDITKNGAALTPTRRDQNSGFTSVATYLNLSSVATVVATDIIRAQVFQNSGGALDFDDYWMAFIWEVL